MEPVTVGIIGIFLLLLLLVLGVHICFVLGLVGVLGLIYFYSPDAAFSYISSIAFNYITPDFAVIPLFVFLGLMAAQGEIVRDTYNAVNKWTGGAKSGLGVSTVIGCTLFGVVCGSAIVTAVVFAKIAAPEMRRQGYEKRFAYGICTSSGIIGMLIPPSVLAVIYALLTEESIGRLLVAGIGPGLVVAACIIAGIVIMIRRRPSLVAGSPSLASVTWKEKFTSLRALWPIILVGLIIIGGIFGGVFTFVESAAVGAFAMLALSLAMRRVNWEGIKSALLDTMSMTGMVFMLLIFARVFSRFLTVSTIAPQLLNATVGSELPILGIMGIIVLVYLVLGCFLDSVSMLTITIPVIYPVIKALGIEPMWFAMIVIVALNVGLITPPVGLNLFGVAAVAEPDVTFDDLVRGALPFFIMLMVALILVFFIPQISNVLPEYIRY